MISSLYTIVTLEMDHLPLGSDNTTVVGTTTSFVDGIWSVRDHQTLTTNVIGIGSTVVRRVFCNISGISTVSFSSTTLSFDSSLFTYDSQLVEVFTGGISSSFSFGKFSRVEYSLNQEQVLESITHTMITVMLVFQQGSCSKIKTIEVCQLHLNN